MSSDNFKDLKSKLSPDAYFVCCLKGTEPPFSGTIPAVSNCDIACSSISWLISICYTIISFLMKPYKFEFSTLAYHLGQITNNAINVPDCLWARPMWVRLWVVSLFWPSFSLPRSSMVTPCCLKSMLLLNHLSSAKVSDLWFAVTIFLQNFFSMLTNIWRRLF